MSINSVQSYQPANVQPTKKTGGVGKAAVSYFIPGLGEFMDGRKKEGAFYLGSRVGVGLAAGALSYSINKDTFQALAEDTIPVVKKHKLAGAAALSILGLGLAIANVVDAYKGAKTDKTK